MLVTENLKNVEEKNCTGLSAKRTLKMRLLSLL